MMNFPSSPTVGQTFKVGNRTWVWNGVVWTLGSSNAVNLQPLTPDTKPLIPNAMDDEFEGASLDSKWAWRNQGASSVITKSGAAVLTIPAGANAHNIRLLEQVLPSGAWKVRTKIRGDLLVNNISFGIALITAGTGKVLIHGRLNDAGVLKHFIGKYTNVNTFSASLYANTDLGNRLGHTAAFQYHEIEYDGTSYYYRVSHSGVDGSFILLASEPATTFLGTADRIAIAGNSYSTSEYTIVCEWFRRIS